jgi:putative ABC transport system permease protein
MSRLFGIPVDSLAVVLIAVLATALGAVAVLALRNRVFFRLGVRNARRRPGRSALIVLGLMLGTAIITAALATGDTMSHTIRSAAVQALGPTDEVVAARGMSDALAAENHGGNGGTAALYFPQRYVGQVARAAEGSSLVDGVEPVIIEEVAVQDVSTSQNEPRVMLFASDPARMKGFGEIKSDGKTVSLADLGPRQVFLNAHAAGELDARAGDTIKVFTGEALRTYRVRAIVRYDGGATAGSGLLMPLPAAQSLLDKPGQIKAIFVSNSGGTESGAKLTDEVVDLLDPTVTPLALEIGSAKQDALEEADTAGAMFMSFFTTFGSFSIAAGILLIFLIFVMLAAERRGELGIARAVGTKRRHLVQMFLYEGLTYDLIAAAVGVVVGAAVAYGMVLVMASAFAGTGEFTISYSVSPASLATGYAIGVLLTLVVVAFSAWRVSRMNISTAIRNLPEPPAEKARRRRWLLGVVSLVLGVLLIGAGVSAKDAVVLGLGVALVIFGLVPLLGLLGVPDRLTRTVAGLALVAWFVLPIGRWLLGDLKVNFSIFLFGGLMIVVGATWTIMYNADVLLGGLSRILGRVPRLAPVIRMSIAYPLRSLFRTGVTLAMFTLVVFTLVVGATTTGAFVNAVDDLESFGGGFDVRASTSAAAPIPDMSRALAGARGLNPADFRLVSSISTLPVKARQLTTSAKDESYLVNGADAAFLRHTTYELAARAQGYGSTQAVWSALREHRNLAVVDQYVVPRKANWGSPPSKFMLSGFYLEDKTFRPVKVTVRDPQTGARVVLTVIGVLSDRTPFFMSGIWTSQATLSPVFGRRVLPTTQLFDLSPGIDAGVTAKKLESMFLANGMQADSLQKLLDDAVGSSLTFDRLIEGFMGLGLIVGVAALGVITARAVVERRQQIGVLRAIGFRKRMVQLSFLIESSFIALTSIVVGTGLGLAVAFSVINDSRRTPSWENMSFVVPWMSLAVIFLAVYLVALATTFAPALRASRVYPAEALRYQ